jgi:hypothetical protein
MAIWEQEDRLGPAVFAARRTAAGWEEPQRLAEHGTAPSIAWNGTRYGAAWTDPAREVYYGGYEVAPAGAWFEGGAWTPFDLPMAMIGTEATIASDGTGFALAWIDPTTSQIQVSVHDAGDGMWEGPTFSLLQVFGGPQEHLAFTGYPGPYGRYGIAWLEEWEGERWVVAGAAAPGEWGWEIYPNPIYGSAGAARETPVIQGGTDGFAIAWNDGTHAAAAVYQDGQGWRYASFDGARVNGMASAGSKWLLVGAGLTPDQPAVLVEWEYGWQTEPDRGWELAGLEAVAVASDGRAFEILLRAPATQWDPPRMYRAAYWPTPVWRRLPLAIAGDCAADAPGAVVWDRTAYVAAWPAKDPADAAVDRVAGQ